MGPLEAGAQVREDFGAIVLGIVISVFGLAALVVRLLRGRSRDWQLLWFGFAATVYGIRHLFRFPTVHLVLGFSQATFEYSIAFLDYVISIPMLLFAETLYGRGWKSCLRWWLWFQVGYLPFAVVLGLVRRDPSAAPDPGVIMLFVMPTLLTLGYVKGYRPPPIAEGRVLVTGGLIFVVLVLNEHLIEANLVSWRWRAEPWGFFALLCCLGYVAARRFFIAEQRLAAIEQEMATARLIQSSILPRTLPQIQGLDVSVRYVPMSAVAGDFYDFLQVDGRGLGILVADVSGHGVPAALIASMIRMAVKSQAHHASDPSRLLAGLNQILCGELQGQFVTAAYLFLDLETGTARYAGAGHPPLLLWRGTAETLHEYQENGLVLGLRMSEEYSSVPLRIQPGDRLLMYTDGILEAMNASQDHFGDSRFRQLISTRSHLPADGFAEAILQDLAAWSGRGSGGSHDDDLTLVILDIQRQ